MARSEQDHPDQPEPSANIQHSQTFAAAKKRVLDRLDDETGREKAADALRRLIHQDRV